MESRMQLLLLACSLGYIAAYPGFASMIPNGMGKVQYLGRLWPAVGHWTMGVPVPGNGGNDAFGAMFRAEGHMWTQALCMADSDMDGRTNGDELGDPFCIWTPGQVPSRTVYITNPGVYDVCQSGDFPCPGTNPMPVDCVFTWGPWSGCSTTCGPFGMMARSPNPIVLAQYGGVPCPGTEWSSCNTNIPCSSVNPGMPSCAFGYKLIPGDLGGMFPGGINGRGYGQLVPHCNVCAGYCNAEPTCMSYECSPSVLTCELYTSPNPTQPPQAWSDYSFCAKGCLPGFGLLLGTIPNNGMAFFVAGVMHGGGERVPNCNVCGSYCNQAWGCNSYKCSATRNRCYLYAQATPTLTGYNVMYGDAAFCVRGIPANSNAATALTTWGSDLPEGSVPTDFTDASGSNPALFGLLGLLVIPMVAIGVVSARMWRARRAFDLDMEMADQQPMDDIMTHSVEPTVTPCGMEAPVTEGKLVQDATPAFECY